MGPARCTAPWASSVVVVSVGPVALACRTSVFQMVSSTSMMAVTRRRRVPAALRQWPYRESAWGHSVWRSDTQPPRLERENGLVVCRTLIGIEAVELGPCGAKVRCRARRARHGGNSGAECFSDLITYSPFQATFVLADRVQRAPFEQNLVQGLSVIAFRHRQKGVRQLKQHLGVAAARRGGIDKAFGVGHDVRRAKRRPGDLQA